MHTVKLKMEDSVYQNIMFILKNLHVKGLEIEEIIEKESLKTTKTDIKALFSNKQVNTFKTIDDPMQWQKQQRAEW